MSSQTGSGQSCVEVVSISDAEQQSKEASAMAVHLADVEALADSKEGVSKVELERALVRKLDKLIMPVLTLMYFLNYIDRSALPHARLNHLENDLGLHGYDYNVAIFIFFVGYMVMQIPSNMFITRTRPSIYLSMCMMAWATVSGATASVTDLRGLLICRILLGFVEAPFYPGALYLLSIFYTPRELSTRIAIMMMGVILSSGSAGMISAGIFADMDGRMGMKGWQWLYVIEGSITFFVAIAGFFLLPDDPSCTRWLTPEERELAVERVKGATAGGVTDRVSTLAGLSQAANDPSTWLFALMNLLHVSAAQYVHFFPSIVESTEIVQSNIHSLLLCAPPYLVAGGFGLLFAWTSGRLNDRIWHITGGSAVQIGGFLLMLLTTAPAPRYASTYVFMAGGFLQGPIIMGWVNVLLSQTAEKKAVAYSIVNVCSTASSIYGSFLFPGKDKPMYRPGFTCMAAFSAASLFCAWMMRVRVGSLNRRAEEEAKAAEARGEVVDPPKRFTY